VPEVMFIFSLLGCALVPILSLICLAIVKKACSTLDAFLAEVSRKGMPRLSANSYVIVSGLLSEARWASYLCRSILDDFFVRHIGLVADKELVDALGRISINFLQPLLDIIERIHVGDIVHHANTVRATVVGRRDCSEAFLASSVPLFPLVYFSRQQPVRTHDLQLDRLAIELNGSDFL
jgi:hypothetical protein